MVFSPIFLIFLVISGWKLPLGNSKKDSVAVLFYDCSYNSISKYKIILAMCAYFKIRSTIQYALYFHVDYTVI